MSVENNEYVSYEQIAIAKKDTPQGIAFQFIQEKLLLYKHYLDEAYEAELKRNDFHSRYWELLSCCLLKQNCCTEISKPVFKKNTSNYDLDVKINDHVLALENVIIKNADKEREKIPADKIWNPADGGKPEVYGSYPSRIQLRIANSVSNKKKQYNALVKDGNISSDRPYVLAIGLYGLPFAFSQLVNFLTLPTNFLGAFFPVEFPVVYVEHPNARGVKASSDTAETHDQSSKSNATYKLSNVKASGKGVSKAIFLDQENSHISAVLLSGFCDQQMRTGKFELTNDFILIHNPLAKNPIPEKILPVFSEYVATVDSDSVTIKNIKDK